MTDKREESTDKTQTAISEVADEENFFLVINHLFKSTP